MNTHSFALLHHNIVVFASDLCKNESLITIEVPMLSQSWSLPSHTLLYNIWISKTLRDSLKPNAKDVQ